MAFKMKNQSMSKLTKAAGDSRVAMKMKKESAMKLKEKSPMEKELVGKQGNLPPELKSKIEAAPAKMRNRKGAMDTEAPLKMKSAMKKEKEGGAITAFGKEYTYANAEEKKALLAKLKTMSQEKRAKEAADENESNLKEGKRLRAQDQKYTDLMNKGTEKSREEAKKLLNSSGSYLKSGSIGKEKKKNQDKRAGSAVPPKMKKK